MKDIINLKFVNDNKEEILKIGDIIPTCILKHISDDEIEKWFEYNKKNNDWFANKFNTLEDWKTSERFVLDNDFPESIVELLNDWVNCFPQFEGVLNRQYFDEFIENDGVLDQSEEVNEIEKRFHEVIMDNVGELIEEFQVPLPSLSFDLVEKTNWASKESFPVPGMYGGFYYYLTIEDCDLVLYSDSWSRICEGSGMSHRITAKESKCIAEGFV